MWNLQRSESEFQHRKYFDGWNPNGHHKSLWFLEASIWEFPACWWASLPIETCTDPIIHWHIYCCNLLRGDDLESIYWGQNEPTIVVFAISTFWKEMTIEFYR
jgi:hypothetical protein